jgi:hypothetical protein
MNFTKLNQNWNADPNAPEVTLLVNGKNVVLEFFLNSFIFGNVAEEDKGRLTFINCHKFSWNTMNDEGYYMGQYRYKHSELPWGDFYFLDTNWQLDFPESFEILNPAPDFTKQKHYIFFLRDNTFECVAENFNFEYIGGNLS